MLLTHQVMQTQLQDFRAMLEFIVDRIQLRMDSAVMPSSA